MSLQGPFSTEVIRDDGFRELVTHLCSRPSMWVYPTSLATVGAYLDGYNEGQSGLALLGFHEWLVVRLNGGNNLHWAKNAEYLIPVDEDEEQRIKALGELILEYLAYRREQGMTKVYYDYGKWLLRKSWYQGPLRKRVPPR